MIYYSGRLSKYIFNKSTNTSTSSGSMVMAQHTFMFSSIKDNVSIASCFVILYPYIHIDAGECQVPLKMATLLPAISHHRWTAAIVGAIR